MAGINHLPIELIERVAEYLPWESLCAFRQSRLFFSRACTSTVVLANNFGRHVDKDTLDILKQQLPPWHPSSRAVWMQIIAAADSAQSVEESLHDPHTTGSSLFRMPAMTEAAWAPWADNFTPSSCLLNTLAVLGCGPAPCASWASPEMVRFNRFLLDSPRAFAFLDKPVGLHSAFTMARHTLGLWNAESAETLHEKMSLPLQSRQANATALWKSCVGGRPSPAQWPVIALNAAMYAADWALLTLDARDLAHIDMMKFMDGVPLPLPKLACPADAPPAQIQPWTGNVMDGSLWIDWFAARSRAIIDDGLYAGSWRGYHAVGDAVAFNFNMRPARNDGGRMTEVRFERPDPAGGNPWRRDVVRVRATGQDWAGSFELNGEVDRESRKMTLTRTSLDVQSSTEATEATETSPPTTTSTREERLYGMVTPFGISGYGSTRGVGCVDGFWWLYRDDWVA